MVVSRNSSKIIDEVVKSSADGGGYTGTADSASGNTFQTITQTAESTEENMTYENYYIMKTNFDDESNPENGSEGELSKQLKGLINLQLDLIEYQQVKITIKDRQIMLLNSEKEQLEARINRMERRLALQKRRIEVDEDEVIKPKKSVKGKTTAPLSGTKNESQQCKAHLPVTVTSRTENDFRFRTHLKTNLTYLDIPESKFLPNQKKPFESEANAEKCESVSVPSWKIVERKYVQIKESPEEVVLNGAFWKRHLKPELEEKRRKRWDLQQLRRQQQQEHLLEQERNKTQRANNITANDEDAFISLYPNPQDIMAIEINSTVPVCVFGYPVPALSIREMELPWFSIAKHEVHVRQAKENLMKKAMLKKRGYTHKKKKFTRVKSVRNRVSGSRV